MQLVQVDIAVTGSYTLSIPWLFHIPPASNTQLLHPTANLINLFSFTTLASESAIFETFVVTSFCREIGGPQKRFSSFDLDFLYSTKILGWRIWVDPFKNSILSRTSVCKSKKYV